MQNRGLGVIQFELPYCLVFFCCTAPQRPTAHATPQEQVFSRSLGSPKYAFYPSACNFRMGMATPLEQMTYVLQWQSERIVLPVLEVLVRDYTMALRCSGLTEWNHTLGRIPCTATGT